MAEYYRKRKMNISFKIQTEGLKNVDEMFFAFMTGDYCNYRFLFSTDKNMIFFAKDRFVPKIRMFSNRMKYGAKIV
jgi:hypothetical protein